MASPDPAAADPFFRVLRERHPDVDVVLLPPTRPRPADPDAWDGDPEVVADDALEALRVVGVALGTDLPVGVRFWKHHDEAAQQHLTVATSVPAPGREVVELRRVGQALLDLGWQARPLERQRPPEPRGPPRRAPPGRLRRRGRDRPRPHLASGGRHRVDGVRPDGGG